MQDANLKDFKKVAFIGTVLKAGGKLGLKGLGMAVKHPVATLGTAASAAFNVSEVGGAAAAASQRAGRVGIPIPPPAGV